MVSIRLSRRGKKNQPSYRVIVVDKRKDPWGRSIEDVGFYNPLTNPATLKVDAERVKYWLSVGAQPTNTMHNLFVDAGLLDTKKVRVVKPKSAKGGSASGGKTTAPAAPAGNTASPSAAAAPKQ